MPWRWRALGGILAAAALASACGGPKLASHPTSPAPVPTGFTRYDGTRLGFAIALAPGWKESSSDPGTGVSFAGPDGLTMLVHVEQSVSADLDTATAAVLFDLTNGSGAGGSSVAAATLAGRHARRVAGSFSGPASVAAIEAFVMVESGRAWAVVLAGPPDAVGRSRDTFEEMAGTFRLIGARPAPPPRAAVGLPAPGFTELDRIRGPVVINFFATWCVDCRSEMPMMAKRARSGQGRFSLLGVDCCDDNRSAVPGFLQGIGVEGDFRLLAYDQDGHIARAYGLVGPPTTVFVDKDHVLRQVQIGPLTATTLEAGLRAAGAA